MNRLSCISINHRNTPLEIREKILLSTRDLQDLAHRDAEIFSLTTCNRTEIYWTGIDESLIFERMTSLTGVDGKTLRSTSDLFQGKEAVRHLFQVSSGLDSLVLGETQILGQVKDAYREALEAKTTSVFLNKALHRLQNSQENPQ
jgi:glutamyl-tRNA reductase